MRSAALFALLGLQAVTVAQDAIAPETLAAVKAATVYLRLEAGSERASGSGFVARRDGDAVYVVTNHHVVTPDHADSPFRMPRGRFGGPFGPFGPPPPAPFGPFGGGAGGPAKVTAVFGSGTPDERSYPATVVTSDEKADLAVLKVEGVKDPPAPLTVDPAVRCAELMTVYSFGFPFGSDLADGKNPAVTVGRATVSALQLDDRRELARVQIEGELNPGNSGGPLVDASGRVVGVAVAKIKDTRIGFAVATRLVPTLFRSKIGRVTFRHDHRAADPNQMTVEVDVAVFDRPIRGLRLDYTPGDRHPPGPGEELADRPNARSADLTLANGKATGTLTLPAAPTPSGGLPFAWQLSYLNELNEFVRLDPSGVRSGTVWHNHPQVAATPPKPADRKPLSDAELTAVLEALAKTTAAGLRVGELKKLSAAKPGPRASEVVAAVKPLTAPDTFGMVRAEAVRVYGSWGGPDATADLAKLLDDKDAFVRRAAIEGLTGTKDAAILAALAKRLRDGFDHRHAMAALTAAGPAGAKAVLPLAKDGDFWVRQRAFEVLGAVGGAESEAALAEAAKNPDRLTAMAAERALAAIKEKAKKK